MVSTAVIAFSSFSNQWRKGNRSLDRTVGAAATLGMAYIIVQLVGTYMRGREESTDSCLEFIARKIKRLIDLSYNPEERITSDPEERITSEVVHRGACHCRSVVFKFRAPQYINARDGKGKIHYPHIRVIASKFKIVTGEEVLKMYYIQALSDLSNGVDPTNAAFSFCSRCGVHMLHAPSSHSSYLDVNVDCLDSDRRRKLNFSSGEEDLSTGVPIVDQWREKDDSLDEQSEIDTSRLLLFGQTLSGSIDGSASAEERQYLQERWISSTPQSFQKNLPSTWLPETPSTVAASSNESYQTNRIQSDIIEDGGIFCGGSDTSSTRQPVSFRESSVTSKINSTTDDSPQTSSSRTTPMMRDQLKYYISKHVSMARKSTPKSEQRYQGIVDTKR